MPGQTVSNSEMPTRRLGRTGVEVSLIGLGGWHLGFKSIDEQLSIRMIRSAIDNGINFMDNCWDYNEGASEIRMGKALRDGYRERAFLMTKIDGRIITIYEIGQTGDDGTQSDRSRTKLLGVARSGLCTVRPARGCIDWA